MYRLLSSIVLVLLVGCSTTSQVDVSDDIKALKWKVWYLRYELESDRCFINYNKCMVDEGQHCWDRHESCVINIYKKYQSQPFSGAG